MKAAVAILLLAAWAQAETSAWLAHVEPVITSAEKKRYLSLSAAERRAFEDNFWIDKLVSQQEYERRLAYIDQMYGSGKTGSGANTDRGRVYLSLGPPNSVTRLPSSRILYPVEIWYYSGAENLGIHYEFHLLFYQRNGTGEYRLYSPDLNTIRDLLNPQSSTRGMFGPNDIITEADIRTQLTLPPAEDEVIEAAVGVARGITGVGNDEILGLVSSPWRALRNQPRTIVTSRLIAERPNLLAIQTASRFGAPQVDLLLETSLRQNVGLEVMSGTATVARNEITVRFPAARRVRYEHRLDLLPGEYRLLFTVDGHVYPYPLTVGAPQAVGPIILGEASSEQRAQTPFSYEGTRLDPRDNGALAVIQLARPGTITWRLRKGFSTVWTVKTDAPAGFTTQTIGTPDLPEGLYDLEASVDGEVRRARVRVGGSAMLAGVISNNENLSPAERYRSIAHQWLVRGKLAESKVWLDRAWDAQPSDAVKIDLSRLQALTGHYDEARAGLKEVLARNAQNFEALAVLAYIESELQDYTVARDLYCRALVIQPSPALEHALAALPGSPQNHCAN